MGTRRSPPRKPAAKPHAARTSLADALFSGTQQRVLGLLFAQPERSFYANEIITLVRGGSGAVQRELARLAASELVTVRESGRQKHYQANARSPIFEELCGIARKTVGLAEPLRTALAPLAGRISAAFVYGSVAKRADTASSDVDLMLVGDDITYADVVQALAEVTHAIGRSVNPTVYSRRELASRVQKGDSFVKRVLAQPKVWILGGEGDLSL